MRFPAPLRTLLRFIGLTLGLGLAVTWIVTRYAADAAHHRRTDVNLRAIELGVAHLNGTEWQAIAEGFLSDESAEDWRHLREDLVMRADEIVRTCPHLVQGRQVHIALGGYLRAITREYEALARRDMETAREIDESEVDPAYDRTVHAIHDALAHSSSHAARAEQLARHAALVAMALALLAVAAMAWSFNAVRRHAAVTAARHDVTAAAERWMQELLRNSSDVLLVVEPDGHLAFVSSAAQEVLGLPAESLLGRPLEAIIHPDDRGALSRLLNDAPGGARATAQLRVHRPGAGEHWLTLEAIRGQVLEVAGSPGIVLSLRDVTERLRWEESLRQSQKMEMVGRLAGGVAHDFNNLLTAILGYTEMLLLNAPDETARGRLDEIRKAGRRAAQLTQQLLAFSRRQIMQPEVFDLNDLVTDMSGMLGRLIRADVELKVDLSPEPVPIRADAGQMGQVLMNLVVNARDALPAEGGRIVVSTLHDSPEENPRDGDTSGTAEPWVILSVSDNGSGIPDEVMAHIFEPFFTTKEIGVGTGLGLATVYGIVEQSGGNIQVESRPGQGATFRVRLPRAAMARAA